ncbi:MAG: pyrroline-5-carboxylate reductase [Planctomycetales bacterium]|nr:pyrroline-5-carboxylate reductase [Planctomycetales bacterium]
MADRNNRIAELSIGFVGAGQMATALARGFCQAGLVAPSDITAFDPDAGAAERFAEAVPGVRIVSGNSEVVAASSVVVLAVKPQVMSQATGSLAGAELRDKLFVSIAAGVTLAQLYEQLGTRRVVRVMPNTPALVGCGAAGYSLGSDATGADGELVGRLFGAVGVAVPVGEPLLDAVTGLSGSGPAFVYAIIEGLSDGGVRMGLPRAVATQLAAQTVQGAARMVLETGEHPGSLKDRVTSPGGTTIAGLQALEDRAVRGAMMAAVEAATKRARELG